MKIAGLTWWRNNYGSILQAYALQTELNNLPNVSYEIINQYGKKIISADNLVDKIRTIGIKKTFQRIFWKFGMRKLRNRSQKIQRFVDQHLHISSEQYSEETISIANREYDAFICGSDQIWNPTLTSLNSMYWLNFAENKKIKISYAPSIGIDRVSDEDKIKIKGNLAGYRAISCREQSGTNFLNQILEDDRCQTVLDPTLLVDKKVWDNICAERKVEKPYIFVYMLRGSKQQRKIIELFAKENKLDIVTIPFLESEHTVWYDLKFGDIKFWDAAPDEFISLIRYAEYVFTDSFHSMVFSCIYHKTFFTFPKIGKAQMNRITDLQSLLGIHSRMVESLIDINIAKEKEINWDKVDQIIFEKRKESKLYLREALGFENENICI